MFYAYVLKSTVAEYWYKGHCSNLEERLKEHNAGKTKSIKHLLPFEIIYFEKFETRGEAMAREKYFKSAAGRNFVKKILNSKTEQSEGSLPD